MLAHAPGHKFKAKGAGLTGEAKLEEGKLISAEVKFPLSALDAGDMLGNREPKKFLDLNRGERWAKGRLLAPVEVQANGEQLSAQAQIGLDLKGQEAKVQIQLEGRLPQISGRFTVRFSTLGYTPPKLLFLKVKDQLDLTIELDVQTPQT